MTLFMTNDNDMSDTCHKCDTRDVCHILTQNKTWIKTVGYAVVRLCALVVRQSAWLISKRPIALHKYILDVP
jgi:hypothetical protein